MEFGPGAPPQGGSLPLTAFSPWRWLSRWRRTPCRRCPVRQSALTKRRRIRPLHARWLAARPLLQVVLPLLAVLAGRTTRVGAVRIGPVRIGSPQRALFGHDTASDRLCGMHLAHDALIARRLLRRNHQRCGREPAAGAGTDREAAGALRQRAEPRAVAVVDVDGADVPVRIG